MGRARRDYLNGQISCLEERLAAVVADLETAPNTEQRRLLDSRARQLTKEIDELYKELEEDQRQSDSIEQPINLEQPGSSMSSPSEEYEMWEVEGEDIEGEQTNNTEKSDSNPEKYFQETCLDGSDSNNPDWVFYQSDNDTEHGEKVFPGYDLNKQEPEDASLGCACLIGLLCLWFAWNSVSNWFQSYNNKNTESKIIAQEGTIVGHDGTKKYQVFLDAYERGGGVKKLGQPNGFLGFKQNLSGSDCIMNSPCFKIQYFSGGSEEKGAIFQSSNDSKAYWVGGDFWKTFEDINSKYNITIEPISDREEYGKWWKQKFSNQNTQPGCTAIFKIETQIFYVDGEIGCHYFHNEGGEKGRLGFPAKNSETYSINSFLKQGMLVKQYFSNGCVEYDSLKNTAITKIPLKKCAE
jgi:hypothetical protein